MDLNTTGKKERPEIHKNQPDLTYTNVIGQSFNMQYLPDDAEVQEKRFFFFFLNIWVGMVVVPNFSKMIKEKV